MAKIDELLSKLMQAQHELTYVVECTDLQNPHPAMVEARKKRNEVVTSIIEHVTELEKKLADLTPHPDDDAHYSEYDNHSRGW